MRPGIDVEVTREPVGVVGLITPWNFPIAIPAWKIAPALAYGNTVVFKPADLVPGCAWALADILARAGIPAGVFNLVMGRGSVVGEALRQPSRRGGDQLHRARSPPDAAIAAKAVARMAKIQLEMGGKNPLVVLDDADLATAVNAAVAGRVLLDRPALHRVVAADRHRGHPRPLRRGADRASCRRSGSTTRWRAGTDIGPVVDAEPARPGPARTSRSASSEGAQLACGGERLKRDTDGYYLSPALFTEAHNAHAHRARGDLRPGRRVIRAKDYDEALALANDTRVRPVRRHRAPRRSSTRRTSSGMRRPGW